MTTTYTITYSNVGAREHTERTNRRQAEALARHLVGNGYDRAVVSTVVDSRTGRSVNLAAWALDESGRCVRVNP